MMKEKTTIVGIILGACVVAYVVTLAVRGQPMPDLQVLGAYLMNVFTLIIAAPSPGVQAVGAGRPGGSVRLRLLVALLVASSLLTIGAVARADDTPATSKLGGGCFATSKLGDVCFAPDVAIAVVAFRDAAPELGFSPGAGYKVELFADRWYTLGAGAYIAITTGASSGSATFLGSFAHYIRAGVARDLYSANKTWYPVLGLGMDFGPSR